MQPYLKLPMALLGLLWALCLSFPSSPCAQTGSSSAQAQRIVLEPNKGTVITTSRAVSAVSIANPDLADVHIPENQEERQILVFSKEKTGTTNLIVWYKKAAKEQVDPHESFDIVITVADQTMEQLSQALHALSPEARVSVHPGGKGVILNGEVNGPETLDAVLKVAASYVNANYTNLITVRGSQQVQLSVRIAEVSRSNLKQMGLGFLTNRDWSVGVMPPGSGMSGSMTSSRSKSTGTSMDYVLQMTTDAETGNTVTTVTSEPTSLDGDSLSRELSSETSLASPFSSAFQLAVHSLDDNFLGILSVLKSQNLARILASPTLVTMSGQEANFLVGGEFPIPISGDDGVTIDYKNYGIMLRFTPTVVAPETITVQVNPEISSIDYSTAVSTGGVSVPGLKTRRASTTLQLKDGQTFVMAGLLNEELATVVNKIPLLGDIPYLGTLFTSKEFQKKESELMVIVTPHLVRALNPEEVPRLPGENAMGLISDSEFFLKNQTEPSTDPEALSGSRADQLIGGSGFAH